MRTMFRMTATRLVRWLLIAAAVYLSLMVLSRWLFPVHMRGSTERLASGMNRTKPKQDMMQSQKQELVDYIADNLDVRYEVINNLIGTYAFTGRLTLKNTGSKPISLGPWMIFFYHPVDLEHIREDLKGAEVADRQMRITHINGGMYKLQPTYLFQTLEPNTSLRFQFEGGRWVTARCLVFPNWYTHVIGAEARVIKSTEGESLSFIGDFDKAPKWKCNSQDRNSPFTPEERYKRNVLEDIGGMPLGILPTPLQTKKTKPGLVKFDPNKWVVFGQNEMKTDAAFLAEKLGMRLANSKPSTNYISLAQGTVELPGADVVKDEAYSVMVDHETQSIQILSPSTDGAFYGVQSVISLLANNRTLPSMKILDAPRYQYRGFMLDVGRNFFGKEKIKKILAAMSMYKLNRFHFHLSDDEAWRLEIPGLPELTTIASRRCHDIQEEECLMPFLGSGPNPSGVGNGFYSVEDYKDILRYAKLHHITVIPETDMPGHSHAAVKAMMARYKRLNAVSKTKEAEEYLLNDPGDDSKYLSVQQFRDNAINVCLDSAFTFVDKIISALVEMHRDVAPLKVVHIGGDEIPPKALKKSPLCEAVMKQEHTVKDNSQLIKRFVQKVMKLGTKYNVVIQGWEDIFYTEGKLQTLEGNEQKIANVWQNVWTGKKIHRGYDMANHDYKVVLGPATHLYLDHPHEPDPEERGNFWATRYTDTFKVFGFMPDSFYENMDVSFYGQPLSKEDICQEKLACPKLTKPHNILGVECHLWTEVLRTEEQLHNMAFPRMIAMAERAWHRASWELERDEHKRARQRYDDWARFINTVGFRELHRLEEMDIKYHLPAPGVIIQDGRMNVNAALPGLPFIASTDNGKTWVKLENENRISGQVLIATSSLDGRRQSRPIKVTIS